MDSRDIAVLDSCVGLGKRGGAVARHVGLGNSQKRLLCWMAALQPAQTGAASLHFIILEPEDTGKCALCPDGWVTSYRWMSLQL